MHEKERILHEGEMGRFNFLNKRASGCLSLPMWVVSAWVQILWIGVLSSSLLAASSEQQQSGPQGERVLTGNSPLTWLLNRAFCMTAEWNARLEITARAENNHSFYFEIFFLFSHWSIFDWRFFFLMFSAWLFLILQQKSCKRRTKEKQLQMAATLHWAASTIDKWLSLLALQECLSRLTDRMNQFWHVLKQWTQQPQPPTMATATSQVLRIIICNWKRQGWEEKLKIET